MRNLILSGGGVKGLLHLGGLKALEEHNLLENIENYAGTSIGSIVVFFLNLGLNYTDLMLVFLKIDFNKFYDVGDIFEFFENYGLFSLLPSERCLKLISNMKLGKNNLTFIELYKLTKKTLNIIAINVNTATETVFNYINTPTVPVIDAIIASCSIPFLLPPKKINGHYYIDAFIVNNYACNVFCDDMENTIGINLIGILDKDCINTEINSFQDFLLNLFISLQPINKHIIKPKLNIVLKSSCSPINTDLTKDEKIELFKNAYIETLEIIKKYKEKEYTNNETTNNKIINNETTHDETINNETINNETTHDETTHNETINNETTHDEKPHDETINNETINNETINNEIINNEIINNIEPIVKKI